VGRQDKRGVEFAAQLQEQLQEHIPADFDKHMESLNDRLAELQEMINQLAEQARELVSGLMTTYLTVVSNRMNEVMKTLTIVASIFVPLTFLAATRCPPGSCSRTSPEYLPSSTSPRCEPRS